IAVGAMPAPHRYKNVMSFDMGGTTAKVGLIQDGQLRLSTEIEVGAQSVTPLGEGRGGGYPIRTPVIDLVEVGAGGGSEAWIDAGGALRVGPRSAGAGPLHANALAREPGIPAVLVPPNPGIASAVGMLMTDLRHEFVTTRRVRLDALTPEALESLFADFLVEGSARLDRDGVPASDRQMLRSVDLRYHGQSFELSIAVPAGSLTVADVERLRAEFDAAHERAYGYAAPEDAVELVNVRLAAIG